MSKLDQIHDARIRLEAAAPDLLNGCKALLGLLQLLANREDIPEHIHAYLTRGHLIDEARAAVAKAEGR